MKRFKVIQIIPVIFLFLLTVPVHAQVNYKSGYFTPEDIQRVKAAKELLDDVDTDSLQETIRKLEKSRHPLINLDMLEAMAKAYTDIVKETDVEGAKKKEWLYSMVCLNMAYLQFGGSKGKYGSTTELNRLIRQKLIKYLSPEVLKQPGFLHSIQ